MTLERSHCFSEQWRVTEYIKKHPYLSAALICLFIEFFTFGDQMYIGAQTILLTMAGLSATLIILLRNKIKHFNYFIPAIIAAFFSVGAMISGSTRKGPAVCFAIILSTVLIILFLYEKKEITPEKLNALVLFASLGICTAYVLYTYSTFRQTDVGGWDAPVGHAGYVKYFVEHNMCLPDFDPRTRSQFYHTPLYYFTLSMIPAVPSRKYDKGAVPNQPQGEPAVDMHGRRRTQTHLFHIFSVTFQQNSARSFATASAISFPVLVSDVPAT